MEWWKEELQDCIWLYLKLAAYITSVKLNYLMYSFYFSVGNSAFRQVIAITVGKNSAPLNANCFLQFFENKCIPNFKKSDLHIGRNFASTFWFINNGLFEKHLNELYPQELEFKKKKNISNIKTSFLDTDPEL